ncbi:MAG: endo alpha-1,4 polygalactosaminidase [Ilumatobacteraceae bacterium]
MQIALRCWLIALIALASCNTDDQTTDSASARTFATSTSAKSTPPTNTPTTTSRGGSWWRPPLTAHWQWLLSDALDLDDPGQMGTDRRTADGRRAFAPTIYDIDGFANPASTIDTLHRSDLRTICYIETGGWEDYRPDALEYPAQDLGKPVDGYPDERYVDIRSPEVLRIVLNRVQMCADKGFDAVEPDLDDTYAQDTGFPLSMADSVAFNSAVADRAHRLGMAIGLKNGDDPEFVSAMEPVVDFALVEQCFEYGTCDAFAIFVDVGKPVFAVEYELQPDEFCNSADALGFNAVLHDVKLNGGGTPCR